jgi:hypothetical protein
MYPGQTEYNFSCNLGSLAAPFYINMQPVVCWVQQPRFQQIFHTIRAVKIWNGRTLQCGPIQAITTVEGQGRHTDEFLLRGFAEAEAS